MAARRYRGNWFDRSLSSQSNKRKMQADFRSSIDWSRPWLAPYRQQAMSLLQTDDWRAALNLAAKQRSLCNHRGLPIRFVPQDDLPAGTAYEAFISATGAVPTRDNLHDFFNGLVWLHFPQIKRQLNALQASEIEKAGGVATRGKVRDALTLFDENAALVVAADDAWITHLCDRRWLEALFHQRTLFGHSIDITLFGHALMEKLVSPYKAITAHAWVITAPPAYFAKSRHEQLACLDEMVAHQLDGSISNARFTPLPVLGVPSWWQGQGLAFYTDSQVFRPKRQSK